MARIVPPLTESIMTHPHLRTVSRFAGPVSRFAGSAAFLFASTLVSTPVLPSDSGQAFAEPFLGAAAGNLTAGPAEDVVAAKGFLQANDTIAWIGSGFTERMQQSNWIDLVLTVADPSLKFRNIGWSGDTVFGDARGVFGGREDGFKRLLGDLDKAKATAAIVCYGENECREGAAGLDAFEKGYRKLLQQLADRKLRIALILPRRFEESAVPNAKYWNEQLPAYNTATRRIAVELKLPVIDLEKFHADKKLTTDGIYWTPDGYRLVGMEMAQQLGLSIPDSWRRQFEETPNAATLANYRDLIRQKNEWFFHYHRPQNETYLFLFRKHEQGNNAAELEEITPEIAALEDRIRQALSTR
ncbi:GDSL-type esterase/lipase family protein [Pirellulaceae bacterium SH467]